MSKKVATSTVNVKKKGGKKWLHQSTYDHTELGRGEYGASISTTNFAAGSTSATIGGNTSGGPNSIQVVIIDDNGNIIATMPQATTVPQGGTWSVTFVFMQSPFQAGHSYYVIAIGTDQTTGMSTSDGKMVGPL